MSGVNPFAPGADSAAHQEEPEVCYRGTRSSSTSKQEVPSETDSLLGHRRTPPPRYSSIENVPQIQAVAGANDGNLAGVHNAGLSVSQPSNVGLFPQPQATNYNGATCNTGVQPGWYPWIPGPAPYYPPGLEHMNGLDQITITGHGNRYRVWRDESHQIFTARLTHGGCWGRRRTEASIRVLNNANLDVLSLSRTFESTVFCSSSNEHLEISFPPGNIVGVVQGSRTEYTVHNPSGDLLFIIERHRGRCCHKGGYEIATGDGYTLGCIGLDKSCCGLSKVVRLVFPPDLDLRSKALLLSAALTIRDQNEI